MKHRREAASIFLIFYLGTTPVLSQSWPSTFDATYQGVVAKNCKKTEHPDFTLFNCESEPAIYYFTKPNTPAHPGAMKRFIENGPNGADLVTDAHSWGSDAAQPAFIAWMNRVAASLGPR